MWYVYIIGKNNKFYTGITTDIKNRLRQHGKPPLIFQELHRSKEEAAKREREIKGWNRKKKMQLMTKFSR